MVTVVDITFSKGSAGIPISILIFNKHHTVEKLIRLVRGTVTTNIFWQHRIQHVSNLYKQCDRYEDDSFAVLASYSVVR